VGSTHLDETLCLFSGCDDETTLWLTALGFWRGDTHFFPLFTDHSVDSAHFCGAGSQVEGAFSDR